eukprot:CAMPEP_0115588136 /NCGR_PEP_ID=MMETSP0272-20121206/8561_1 /TAXON_ID=71861 /ORGANISM="Scrippsiella trochoidea, Strain CCMP3099" /LENGTH=250 /DNA_ID=CAMNT_0003023227 /DNA_START=1 /DNA_END=750 /DNA_ORIENTATION=-
MQPPPPPMVEKQGLGPGGEMEGAECLEIEEEILVSELLGIGFNYEVCKGRWTDKDVAVKRFSPLLRPGERDSPVEREISVLSRVKHPNLVQLYGTVLAGPPYCIVMELCNGGRVADYIHKPDEEDIEFWTWSQAFKIAKDTASAMSFLHGLDVPIIHGDLKSTKMLLKEPIRNRRDVPTIKLSGLGLAHPKPADGQQMACRFANCDWIDILHKFGTCNWLAPEILQGRCYDEKIDVYAFAMVLFELSFLE